MPAVIKIEIISSSADKGLRDTARGLDDIDKAAKNTKGGFDTLKGVGVAALGAVALAAGAAALAIGSFVKDSIGAAGAFEAGVNKFASVTGSSLAEAGFDLDAVSAKALQLGKDTQYSAQQAMDAMTELAKGGVPVESVMTDATDATLALAAAGGLELAPAAEIVAKSLGVWARDGVKAIDVSNLLAAAANASTVDVAELADGMSNAAGRAQAMELDYKDFVTTMALIAPAFGSAQEAGTSYNSFLSRLQPTTKGATKAMVELGFITEDGTNKFFDSTGAFIGNRAAAQMLQDAMGDLSPAMRGAYMQAIFQTDAMGAANAMMQEGAAGYDRMAGSMAAMGGAQDVAAVKQQGFAFAMETLSGSIETLQIVIGTKLLPILTPLIGQFTELVNATMGVASAIFDAGLGSGEFLESLGLLDAALRLAPGSAEAAYTAFMQIANTVQSYIPPALALAQAAFVNLSAFIATIMPTIVAIVSNTLPLIAAFWQAHGATILQIASSVWVAIQGVIQVVLGVIQGVMALTMIAITGDWQSQMGSLASANEAIWNGISTFLLGVLNTIAAFFGTSVDGLIALWSSNLSKLATIALTSINAALVAFRTAIAPAMEIGSAIISGIISGISSGAGKLAKAASDAANSALKAAKSALGISSPSLVFNKEVGQPIAEGMAAGIMSGVQDVINAGQALSNAALGGALGNIATGAPSVSGGGGSLATPERKRSNSGSALADAVRGLVGNSKSTTNNYNYSPTYSATPANPSSDFGMMKSLATAGT